MFVRVIYGELDVHEEGAEGGYAYRCTDDSVGVGDIVKVPGTFLHRAPQLATIIGFGLGGYDGEVASVLSVVRRRAKEQL
jgi:hypothetical protein